MRTSILAAAIVLSVVFATPAALAQQPGAAGFGKLDACTLVTKADIQEAVGASVADGKPNPAHPQMCDFKVGDYGMVSFFVRQPNSGETPDKAIAELKKRNIESADAKGIGDRSFFASMGYGMVQLNTYKGTTNVILTVFVPGAPEAKERAIAEKLMLKALPKL